MLTTYVFAVKQFSVNLDSQNYTAYIQHVRI